MAQSTARTTRSAEALDRVPAKAKKASPAKAKAPTLRPVKGATRPSRAPARALAKTTKPKKLAKPAKREAAEKVLAKASDKTEKLAPKVDKLVEKAVAKPVEKPVEKKAELKPPPAPPVAPKRITGVVAKGYVPLVDIPPLPPPPSDFALAVGEKAVHPSHGLGEVTAIEHRELGGIKGEFYILRILDNGMRVMVPRATSATAGLRPVMSAKEADRVLETMRAREVAVDLQPWSRRFRAYTEMIKSGSPQEVAKVLRDMYRLKFDKDLSFGERRLLDQAKSLLMKELAAAKGMTEAALQAQVDDMFRA